MNGHGLEKDLALVAPLVEDVHLSFVVFVRKCTIDGSYCDGYREIRAVRVAVVRFKGVRDITVWACNWFTLPVIRPRVIGKMKFEYIGCQFPPGIV
jgi:hypothetical protein